MFKISVKGQNYWSSDSELKITPQSIPYTNVYMYKGSDIYSASSIEKFNDNEPLTETNAYSVPFTDDIILIALPINSTVVVTDFKIVFNVVGTVLVESN